MKPITKTTASAKHSPGSWMTTIAATFSQLAPVSWPKAKNAPIRQRNSMMPFMRTLLLLLAVLGATTYTPAAYGATLLPNGSQTFDDGNGNPLAGGSVYFYVPSTLTPKDTWKDSGGSVLNTNPVVLDSAGRAVIYGTGSYRQIVKDSLGNTVWDKVTADTSPTTSVSWGGTSGGSANAQTVTASGFALSAGSKLVFLAGFTNTGALTINPNGAGATTVLKPSLAAPAALSGGEVVAGNVIEAVYDGAVFQLVDPVETPIVGPGTNIASAGTTDLATITSHYAVITGVTTVTSFGSNASTAFPLYFVKFGSTLTLTYNATSLILPGGQNISTSANDVMWVEYLGTGNWRVLNYVYANVPWVPTPQGRLTLTTATPVMVADVTSSASIFYTPYVGNLVTMYNGTTFAPITFAEQTLALVASHAANSNYDIFEAYNAGVLTLCTGPAWTSDTARGAGAGTTEITRILGIYVNAQTMATCRNGGTTFSVSANRGTYLGTFRTSGSTGDTVWTAAPAAAAGGGNSRLYLWNTYNRRPVIASTKDNTVSWAYTTTAWRAADAGAAGSGLNNRISAVYGLNEDAATVVYDGNASASTGLPTVGVALDATNTFTGITGTMQTDSANFGENSAAAVYIGWPGLGLHFFQATEYGAGSGTFYGLSTVNSQSGMYLQGQM